MKNRRRDPDDYAQTQVLGPAAMSDGGPKTEEEIDALYQAYLKACRDAGLEPIEPKHRKK